MSYPQPLASREIIDGSQFYRLFTPLQSGGDAYELNISALAFAIGPQSDLSSLRLTYFDPSQPNEVNSAVIGVGTPFASTIAALASRSFSIANTKAQIIVTPEDLWNNNWYPLPLGLAEDLNYIKPKIDLFTFLTSPVIALPSMRADFVERGRLNISALSTAYRIAVPFYGRKYAEFRIRNNNAGVAGLTVDVIGVNFTTDGLSPYALTDFIVMETPIITAGVVGGANSTTTFRVQANAVGLFDYLMIRVNGAPIDGAVPDAVRYILRTSDMEI